MEGGIEGSPPLRRIVEVRGLLMSGERRAKGLKGSEEGENAEGG
jgi:hypothetical protein